MRRLVLVLVCAACGSKAQAPAAVPEQPPAAVPAEPEEPEEPEGLSGPELREAYDAWLEKQNQGQWDRLGMMLAEDATLVPASSGMKLQGRANILEFFKSFALGFPDMKTWPLVVLSHPGEQRVVAVAVARGTNTEPMGPAPATGKVTSFTGLTVLDFDQAGSIRRIVAFADNINFMGQLGQWEGDVRDVVELPEGAPEVADHTGGDPEKLAVAERWFEAFNAHDAPAMMKLYHAGAVYDDSHLAGPVVTAQAIAQGFSDFFPAFPDVKLSGVEMWTAGDYVVATYDMQATHGGPYDRFDAKATMRQLEIQAAALFEIRGDEIAEHRVFVDGMAMAYQLGVLVLPGG